MLHTGLSNAVSFRSISPAVFHRVYDKLSRYILFQPNHRHRILYPGTLFFLLIDPLCPHPNTTGILKHS